MTFSPRASHGSDEPDRGDREPTARGVTAPRSPAIGAITRAAAASDARARDDLLDRAQQMDDDHPTYYGAAWVALGRVVLTTRDLGGC